MGHLKRLLQKMRRTPAAHQPPRPAIDNPYRRFYSRDRSFEDLVRRAKDTPPDAESHKK